MRIAHSVHLIQQRPGSNECWAAALAMAMGRASNHGTDRVIRMAAAAGVVVGANGGLPPNNFPNARRLANVVGLDAHDASARQMPVPSFPSAWSSRQLLQSTPPTTRREVNGRPSLDRLKRFLDPGLVVIMGAFNIFNVGIAPNHAVVVYKIEGDDTPTGTMVYYVDPLPGRVNSCDFQFFDDTFMADPLYLFTHRPTARRAG
jgi:hypothetical protein